MEGRSRPLKGLPHHEQRGSGMANAVLGREARLFGLPVDALDMAGVLQVCSDSLETRDRTMIGVINAAKVVSSRRDPGLLASLLDCDLLLADGQSVVWASRLLRDPLPERVAGIDIFERLLKMASERNASIYLLGARPDVVRRLERRIVDDYPGLTVAGARDGYFSENEAESVAAEIRGSGADMLFLGMVSPKKENFLRDWGSSLGVPVQHGVGGSFDVLAGVTQRAPEAWQRYGMEWAYRLRQEPRRLWKRYLTTNSAFIALTFKEMARKTPSLAVDLREPVMREVGDGEKRPVVDLRDARRRTAVPATGEPVEAPVAVVPIPRPRDRDFPLGDATSSPRDWRETTPSPEG